MAPVTELCRLYPTADTEGVLSEYTKIVLRQPGVKGVYTSVVLEEDNPLIYLIVNWDSIAAHEAFTKTDIFEPAVKKLTDTLSKPYELYHVDFSPVHPAVLLNAGGKSAVTELAQTYFPAGEGFTVDQMASVAKNVQGFLSELPGNAAGHTGEVASGWAVEEVDYKGEKSRVFVFCVGWDSVEAHRRYSQTDHFKKAIPRFTGLGSLKGSELDYISTKSG